MSRPSRHVHTPNTEEDEKTQVLKTASPAGRTSTQPPRQAGLPPPLIGAKLQAPGAQAPTADPSDDEPTRILSSSEQSVEPTWLISDGLSAPRELGQSELLAQLRAGSVSSEAFAWQRGMKEWQKVTDIATLSGAFGQRSETRSSSAASPAPPPKTNSTLPIDRRDTPKLGRTAPLIAVSRILDSRRNTPKLGPSSALLSRSVPTADFGAVAKASRTTSPDPASNEPRPNATPKPADNDSKPPSAPRPAAGRKPLPDEPVAKAEPLLGTSTPSVLISETGDAPSVDTTKLAKQREVTEPARSRLALAQLYASRPPSMLLWLLGAGGWVVAGVLAGVLIARGHHGTPTPPAPMQAAPQPTQAPVPARTATLAAPVPTSAEEEMTQLAEPAPAPAPLSPPFKPPSHPSPASPGAMATAKPTLPAAPATLTTPATAPAAVQPEPTPADDLNSPGF